MPWKIVKKSGPRPWKIVRSDTGKVVGSSTSEAAAQASMRARYASMKGKEKL
jgi:hypothetical protein